jgi:hypothetical protein
MRYHAERGNDKKNTPLISCWIAIASNMPNCSPSPPAATATPTRRLWPCVIMRLCLGGRSCMGGWLGEIELMVRVFLSVWHYRQYRLLTDNYLVIFLIQKMAD